MSLLQRLLLLPLLSPLLAVLLLGALNPRPWVALRLLTWTSPAWPLGAWIGGAAAAGAALSAAAAGLALQTGAPVLGERRQVRRRPADDAEAWDGFDEGTRKGASPAETADSAAGSNPWSAWAGPTRAAADPPPTVSVPFRVIRKGRSTAPTANSTAAAAAAPQAATTSASAAAAAGDDWGTPSSDDW